MLTEKQRMIQKKIALYQAMGDQTKEKEILQNALIRYPNWDFAVQRLQELNINNLSQEEILKLSYQYQKEWRFERDKQLMEQALTLFPNWDYVHKRLEWHSRPIFHRDPEKSKTQPRKPLHLPRDPNYIPKQETLDSLCFITASGSDSPYFELSVQLIESIKATRWYNNIPVKVLDCGLTEDDANYLREKFKCEVKNPGWSIDPSIIDIKTSHPFASSKSSNGWKGLTERPYIHKHFPGYTYYFWLDTDTWIQDERAIDQLLYLCEKQGMSATREFHNAIWATTNTPLKHPFGDAIPSEFLSQMEGEKAFINDIYCFHKDFGNYLIKECEQALQQKMCYKFGFDLAILNYTFYKYIPNGIILTNQWLNNVDKAYFGVHLDKNKNLMINIPPHNYLGFIGLDGKLKHFPYYMIFSNIRINNKDIIDSYTTITLTDNEKHFARLQASQYHEQRINNKDIIDSYNLTEEEKYLEYLQNHRCQGNYFYRIYPEPENLYDHFKVFL